MPNPAKAPGQCNHIFIDFRRGGTVRQFGSFSEKMMCDAFRHPHRAAPVAPQRRALADMPGPLANSPAPNVQSAQRQPETSAGLPELSRQAPCPALAVDPSSLARRRIQGLSQRHRRGSGPLWCSSTPLHDGGSSRNNSAASATVSWMFRASAFSRALYSAWRRI